MIARLTVEEPHSFDRLEAGRGYLTQKRNDTIMKEHGTVQEGVYGV